MILFLVYYQATIHSGTTRFLHQQTKKGKEKILPLQKAANGNQRDQFIQFHTKTYFFICGLPQYLVEKHFEGHHKQAVCAGANAYLPKYIDIVIMAEHLSGVEMR